MNDGERTDDDLFAQLLDAYDRAYWNDSSSAFWRENPCSQPMRQRVETAHDALKQLDSYLTRRIGAEQINTPIDMSVSQWLGKPVQVGRFEVVRELGRGGFGVVYLANDPVLHRQVAIKLPRFETLGAAELQQRFMKEAEIAASLDHPHIVPVLEVGHVAQGMYIVSPYCPGTNLAQWLTEHPRELTTAQTVEFMIAAADAMTYCHQRGVLHRDLKPANVLLFPAPADPLPFTPRINDFGLAKVLESTMSQTASNAMLGTPLYMAPEQVLSQTHCIGPATDVYGLGAILYELLTGHPPFRGTVAEILDQIRTQDPIKPREQYRAIPIDLETICLKCLAKRTEDRYATAAELLEDLRAFQSGQAIRARRIGWLELLERRCGHVQNVMSAGRVISAVQLLLTGILVIIAIYWNSTRIASGTVTTVTAAIACGLMINLPLMVLGLAVSRNRPWAAIVSWIAGISVCGLGMGWIGYQLRQPQRYPEETSWLMIIACALGLWALHTVASACAWHAMSYTRAFLLPQNRGTQTFYRVLVPTCLLIFGMLGAILDTFYRRSHLPRANELTTASGMQVPGAMDESARYVQNAYYLRKSFDSLRLGKVDEAQDFLQTSAAAVASQESQSFSWNYLHSRIHAPRRQYDDLASEVLCTDISPDGRWIVGGDRSGNVCIWMPDGTLAKSFNYSEKEICAVEFSPDGQWLATAGQNSQVYLWRTESWESATVMNEFQGTINAVAWSPDSKRLVTGTRQNRLSVWDVQKSERITRLAPVLGAVRGVAWSADGALIAAVFDNRLSIWNTANWEVMHEAQPSEHGIYGVAFAPDSQTLVAAGFTEMLQIVDVMNPTSPREIEANGPMRFVDWSADGRYIAAAVSFGGPRIWSSETFKEEATLERAYTRLVKFSHDGHSLLSARGNESTITHWDLRAAMGIRELSASESILTWSGNGAALFYVTSGSSTRLFNAELAEPIMELKGAASHAALSDDGKVFVRLYDDQLEVWDQPSRALRGHLPKPDFHIATMDISSDGQRLYVSSHINDWALYDLTERKLLAHRGADKVYASPAYAFEPSGQRILVRLMPDSAEGDFCLLDTSSGRFLHPVKAEHTMRTAAFDSDRAKIYLADADGIHGYDLATQTLDSRHFRLRRGIQSLALSPDGLTLAIWIANEGIFLWDVRTGQELFPILQTDHVIDQLQFTSNTQLICRRANAPDNHRLVIFQCDPSH